MQVNVGGHRCGGYMQVQEDSPRARQRPGLRGPESVVVLLFLLTSNCLTSGCDEAGGGLVPDGDLGSFQEGEGPDGAARDTRGSLGGRDVAGPALDGAGPMDGAPGVDGVSVTLDVARSADGSDAAGVKDATTTLDSRGDAQNDVRQTDATSAARRKRVIFFYTPHGTWPDAWTPRLKAGEDFSFGPILAPLESIRSHVLVLGGIDHMSTPGEILQNFHQGTATLLTGHRGMAVPVGGSVPYFTAGAPSLDHLIARASAAAVAGPSQLHLGLGLTPSLQLYETISYGGPKQPNIHETDPRRAYPRILKTKPPAGVEALDPMANDSYPAVGRAHMDLIVAAFAKDLAVTASLMWGDTLSNVRFNWLGVTTPYHLLTHELSEGTQALNSFIRIQNFFADQFVYLVKTLAAVRDGDGTLLDNVLVFWLSDGGRYHSGRNLPVVLAGRLGGHFRTGRFLIYQSASHVDLLASIAEAFGVGLVSDPAFKAKPLPNLR